ncbi:Hemolysin-type calcium-binding region [Pseudodesulfovibrio mercurii]|uniref:Hemolysin-type calcium-binding region n=1 Tax=Pseudodesulfovibrio mercurii TaxID=641491 RepID=F0JBP0_9BACT|nr:hypothetical protein [Pseudodesulfovibrio mercurii]EGB15543.1 Hemolysin-type calcium-binding region [Pseudodesulfovibrio mercurii]
MAERINVLPPESGERETYRLEAGVPVKFAFDLSEAEFAASGNDLVISLPWGGSVVLQGYLDLAGQHALPVFELLDGQLVAGGVYLFAFGREFETAAGDMPDGSGAGAYADDPGALGNGLDAMSGQSTLFGESPQPQGAPSAPLPPAETAPLAGQSGQTIYPETESVQIVLNPSFEASGYTGDTWTWLDDVDHWRNTGDPAAPVIPQFRRMMFMAARSAAETSDNHMKTWGQDMPQTPSEGERLMELDATSGTIDTLSQAIATKAGEAVTIAFHFAPRVDESVRDLGMDTNDFQLTLGDQLVATVTWDADAGDWLVTLGEGVTAADGTTDAFHFSNLGYTTDGSTDWTELVFTLTADQDHADLTFSEFSAHNDGYGTLIDDVTAYRDFDTLITGGESDAVDQAEYLTGTDGDDAIFGSAHTVVDGVDNTYSYAEVIDGGAGDDALYGGQNFLTVISGGSGNDFIVAGRPLVFGTEESHDTSEPVGETFILPGSGDDYVRLGDGSDSIILNRDALVDGETLIVENFTVDDGETLNYDQLFLADGLSLQSASQLDGDLHLLIGDGHETIQVTLLGVEAADINAILHTGSDADTLNDQIQAIIDSGGHLA